MKALSLSVSMHERNNTLYTQVPFPKEVFLSSLSYLNRGSFAWHLLFPSVTCIYCRPPSFADQDLYQAISRLCTNGVFSLLGKSDNQQYEFLHHLPSHKPKRESNRRSLSCRLATGRTRRSMCSSKDILSRFVNSFFWVRRCHDYYRSCTDIAHIDNILVADQGQGLVINGTVCDTLAGNAGFGRHCSLLTSEQLNQAIKWYDSALLYRTYPNFRLLFKMRPVLMQLLGSTLPGWTHSFASSLFALQLCSSHYASCRVPRSAQGGSLVEPLRLI